jgi:calcineurin-like phosphoesterase family protein
MARWFTSDLHFGHENIIRFCNRPFDSVHEMNVEICRSINSKVGPEDELWILGDLALGNSQKTIPIVRHLTAGTIHFVSGNHDRCHPYNGSKHEKWIDQYKKLFSGDLYLGNTSLTLSDGTHVEVSHFPYIGDSYDWGRGTDRFSDWRVKDQGNWLLCGHVHDSWKQNNKMINVGIDVWGGLPASEYQIIETIAQGPQLTPKDSWKYPKTIECTLKQN